jgi:alkylation response protein AidB-like acyl-CoA dehydrogenase
MEGSGQSFSVRQAVGIAVQRVAFGAAIDRLVPSLAANAALLDECGDFPAQEIAALHLAGALVAPFPPSWGGLGVGTEPDGAATLALVLRALGRGNMAVGRLYEAHVNAVRLLVRYASPGLIARAARDAAAGFLFGLWVTDDQADPLRSLDCGDLIGCKSICSGAGHIARAVVTVDEGRLAYLATDASIAVPSSFRLQGMRAATSGRVSFKGCRLEPDALIGGPDDYLREPDFSGGAWRTSAVTVGGLEALVAASMRDLFKRGRAGDPHQLARMGRVWILQETALMWLARSQVAVESGETSSETAVMTVNFARVAIEAACLEAITLIERSIGLGAFQQSSLIERLRRDLATYLRQPAPDAVLTEAAASMMASL